MEYEVELLRRCQKVGNTPARVMWKNRRRRREKSWAEGFFLPLVRGGIEKVFYFLFSSFNSAHLHPALLSYKAKGGFCGHIKNALFSFARILWQWYMHTHVQLCRETHKTPDMGVCSCEVERKLLRLQEWRACQVSVRGLICRGAAVAVQNDASQKVIRIHHFCSCRWL